MKYKHKITGEEVKVYNEHYYIAPDTACIPKRFIENSNDWKKLEELDYDILSFFNKMNKRVYHFDKALKSFYSIDNFHNNVSYDYCLKYYEINSVKRLSDGQVFTVGDEATIESDEKRYKIIKIRKFTNTIQIHGEIEGRVFFYNLNDVIKLQPINPLFTTEDGVEIFEGDDFFVIETQFDKYRLHKTIGGHFTKERSTRLRFHSKEKAEEYALLNKPCLSLNNLLSVWGPFGDVEDFKTSPLFHNFLELAKSKL